MAPCLSSPNRCEFHYEQQKKQEQRLNEEEEEEDGILRESLLEKFDKELSKDPIRKPQESSECTKKQPQWILGSLLLIVFGLWMLFHNVICNNDNNNGMTTTLSTTQYPTKNNDMLRQIGWIDTIQYFQNELKKVSNHLKEETTTAIQQNNNETSSLTIAIDPLCNLIEEALDTVGLRGVILGIFNDELEYYYINDDEDRDCAKVGHGVGCEAYDIWWMWHYTGATVADKLAKEGSLLLDSHSGQRLHEAVEVMHEFHRIQATVFANTASYHIQHGFVMHHVAMVQPYMAEYPIQLADEFCGYYLQHHVTGKGYTTKGIGAECYHALGHAVFAVIALRQLQMLPLTDARIQLRPRSGFVLSDDAICDGYQICRHAPTESRNLALRYCHGGIIHTQRLLNPVLEDHEQADPYFEEKWAMCEERMG